MATPHNDSCSISNPASRLAARLAGGEAPICVGLDPVFERLPGGSKNDSPLAAIESFCGDVLEAVKTFSPCIKIQSACFERYGSAGVATLERVVRTGIDHGFEFILDAKRGDIGISASHYAVAARATGVQWVTVNGYLGEDGIRPFLDEGLGVFVLVRTSNPSSDDVQDVRTHDGSTVAAHVGTLLAKLGEEYVDGDGHSSVGAVVGATKPTQAAALRALMPRQLFLLPGWGAQGGGVKGVRAALDDTGAGVLVSASRSILYADNVAAAAETFAREIKEILGQ